MKTTNTRDCRNQNQSGSALKEAAFEIQAKSFTVHKEMAQKEFHGIHETDRSLYDIYETFVLSKTNSTFKNNKTRYGKNQ